MMNEKEVALEIQKFLEEFPYKKINGKSMNDIQYEGWSIWWFFKKRFIGNLLLSPLSTHQQIIKSIIKGEEFDFNKKIRNKLIVFTLKKFVKYNEEIKHWVSNFSRKTHTVRTTQEKKRIMFLSHTNGIIPDKKYGFTVDRIGSVVKEVREDPHLEEYISIVDPLSSNSCLRLLKYENLVYSYMNKEINEKSKKNSSLLHKKWNEISDQINYESYLERSIWEHFRPALDLFFSKEMIHLIILYYETYKKIIVHEKIKLLCFYSGSDVISKCAIAAACKLGIKSLHITHGFSIPRENPDQPTSVYYAVFGSKFKERLVQLGVNPKNIFVTGPTYMDEIVYYLKNEYSHRNKQKRILLATGNFVESGMINKKTYFEYISNFLGEVNKIEDSGVIIKLHPLEKNLRVYKSIVESLGLSNKIKIVEGRGENQLKSKLYGLIHESDIVFSFGSTVTREAMVMGKPSLIIDLSPTPFADDRKKVMHIDSKEDVSKIISDIFYNPDIMKKILDNQKEFVEEYFYRVDGKAGERVIKHIKELIKN